MEFEGFLQQCISIYIHNPAAQTPSLLLSNAVQTGPSDGVVAGNFLELLFPGCRRRNGERCFPQPAAPPDQLGTSRKQQANKATSTRRVVSRRAELRAGPGTTQTYRNPLKHRQQKKLHCFFTACLRLWLLRGDGISVEHHDMSRLNAGTRGS